MDINAGQIIERVIRRNKVSISELARRMQVNRRSVYNWFDQKTLKLEIICKIGHVLDYDFSVDFPEILGERGFGVIGKLVDSADQNEYQHPNSAQYWMIKYISLLEKYNEMLFLEAARKGQIKTGEIKKLQSKSLTQNVYDPDSILL